MLVPLVTLVTLVIPLHLGPLHPVERVLTLVLAFGPFLLLALTIWITRRRNAPRQDEEA